ncbi:hypothetical protein DFH07DRAFT_578765 [Mycena maculata]|uniref:Uncharacterized protein n=1 Tax=Mycena maculata TaxID=230809 RepID=A0AAD7N5V9_9AGAR|nr:hypothetical protein DFH07DRAFT_578765 [Mycena maculata]
MTNSSDPGILSGTKIEPGKNPVDAAKEVGVKFFVWKCASQPCLMMCVLSRTSSLPNATAVSGGKYSTVYHFDIRDKTKFFEYLKASGLPCTTVSTGWLAENLWKCLPNPTVLGARAYLMRISYGFLQKISTGYRIPIPRYSPESM